MLNNLDIDTLVSMVDTFLEPFGLDSDFDTDFFYDPEDETVFFSLIISERADRLFRKYVHDTFSFNIPNIFMFSLLHEVGHSQTLWTFPKKILRDTEEQKRKISKALEKTNSDEFFLKYFDLEVERLATEWAVNYYKTNTKQCEDFYSIFSKELHRQYAEIGLTE